MKIDYGNLSAEKLIKQQEIYMGIADEVVKLVSPLINGLTFPEIEFILEDAKDKILRSTVYQGLFQKFLNPQKGV